MHVSLPEDPHTTDEATGEESVWYSALEYLANSPSGLTVGTSQVACPFCNDAKAMLAVSKNGIQTRIACGQCKRFIEGQFQG